MLRAFGCLFTNLPYEFVLIFNIGCQTKVNRNIAMLNIQIVICIFKPNYFTLHL